jgi:hypothetical protein
MANNYSQGTIQPSVPEKYLTPDIIEDLESFGITCEFTEKDKTYYLFIEFGLDDEEEAVKVLQSILQKWEKVSKKRRYFEIGIANTCDKLRPGEFGGSAIFITPKSIKWENTYTFLEDNKRNYLKKR